MSGGNMPRFTRKVDFASLSLIDLIEARDLYHVQLANLPNVIGTAVGRYLISCDDPRVKNPSAPPPKEREKGPRILHNVSIMKWSWPAVLVYVDKGHETSAFQKNP